MPVESDSCAHWEGSRLEGRGILSACNGRQGDCVQCLITTLLADRERDVLRADLRSHVILSSEFPSSRRALLLLHEDARYTRLKMEERARSCRMGYYYADDYLQLLDAHALTLCGWRADSAERKRTGCGSGETRKPLTSDFTLSDVLYLQRIHTLHLDVQSRVDTLRSHIHRIVSYPSQGILVLPNNFSDHQLFQSAYHPGLPIAPIAANCPFEAILPRFA